MTTDVPTSDGTSGDSGGDAIAVFTALRPSVAAPSADELDAMRRAAFAAGPQCAVLPTESAEVAQPILVPATADRPRLRVGVALLAAAAIVATLAIAVRPDRGTTPIGPGTTGAPAVTKEIPTPVTIAVTSAAPTSVGTSITSVGTSSTSSETTSSTSAASQPTLPNHRLDPLTAFYLGTENGVRQLESPLGGQSYVADCMHTRGWGYTQSTINDVYDPITLLRIRDPDEFRRRYGYGLSTTPNQAGTGTVRDPNTAYLASLTQDQQAAWRADLGPDDPGNPGAAPSSRASCWQLAFDGLASAGVHDLSTEVQLAAFDPRYDFGKDARFVQATAAWRLCLATAGVQVGEFEAPSNIIQRRLGGYVPAGTLHSDTLPTIPPTQLAALQDEERALAATDHRCNAEAGLDASELAARTDVAAALRARFPDVVVEPYDPNLG